MRIIKQLSADIACNIREAEDKIMTAYRLRDKYPQEAMWYRDMAVAHLGFNGKAHDLVALEITTYRNSDEYKEHPEYADGMQAVWADQHADLVAENARIQAMIAAFK